ncbi:MAG: hypothetical protein LUQ36_11445 [Methanoregula sp.]|jgi:hypothetical protein|nr:hypothetical protein [Methanoregula sp.]
MSRLIHVLMLIDSATHGVTSFNGGVIIVAKTIIRKYRGVFQFSKWPLSRLSSYYLIFGQGKPAS